MPELHENQIKWAAPEPQKVSLAKPDYSPLADAFNGLGRAADEFSRYKATIDDVEAKEKLNLSAANALTELERRNPSDNDYTEDLAKFNQSLQDQFAAFNEPTKERFLHDNPTYFEEQKLKAEALVFEKQQKFYITKTKNIVPLLASNVTEGKESYESQRKILDNMVANMDNVTAEELINYFDRHVQVGNIDNLIANGMYSDAITLLESPKDSDKISPEERTQLKLAIQKQMKEEAKAMAALRKEATKDINDAIEVGLVNSLLITMDRKDDSYARLVHLLDDPNAKIELMDSSGKVVQTITAKDIPVVVRRDALKKARTYEEDSMSYRVNSIKAKELAQNFETMYKEANENMPSGETFNNIYAFTQSDDFYYLDKTDQEKMLDIVYGEVNRYNEQVIPYENIKNQRLLYGVGANWSGPSGPNVVRSYVFGKEKTMPKTMGKQKESLAMQAISSAPFLMGLLAPAKITYSEDVFENKQVGFRQLTTILRDTYEKQKNHQVRYGSELEFLMDTYAAALSYTPQERAQVGLENATDEQIGLSYARLLGALESSGRIDKIIGQDMSKEQAENIRKDIFNSFYTMTHNGAERQMLTKEQEEYKRKYYESVVDGSYGTGGKALTFTPTEMTVVDEKRVYPTPLTNNYFNKLKKEKK